MKKVELSAEQRAAIVTPGNLLVRAGAGSGKTEVLARRFAALVAGDVPGTAALLPARIVAITFTEKATHDMRERIRQVLEERVAEPRDADEAHLRRALRTLALARISTIHAFCARILRENPLEAGIDPAFEVLDEYESNTFLERSCRELLAESLRAGDPGATHLLGARPMRDSAGRRAGALDLVMQLIGGLQRLGKDPQWLRAAARATSERLMRFDSAARAAELIDAIEQLLRVPGAGGKAGEQLADLRARWPRYREVLMSFGPDAPESSLQTLRELCEKIPDRRGAVKDAVGRIRGLLASGSTALELEGVLIEAYGAARAARPTLDIADLIGRLDERLETLKRREAVVSFDDLLILTERLLRERPAVQARYRREFAGILVDEYQDTNPIQDSIVRLLSEPGGGDLAPQLFIVGDEKQSIYRFRGTDVRIFIRERSPAPTRLTLKENRRSTAGVLSFVNALSKHVMRPAGEPRRDFRVEWNDDDHRLIPRREATDEPAVEIVLAVQDGAGEKRNAFARREVEAAFLAERAREIVAAGLPVYDTASESRRPTRFGDVAILMRSFTDVAIYERALREAGVPCHTVKGRGFFGCREVLDLAELINVISDPDDAIALVAVLRSPLFALSDQCLLEMALDAHERGTSIAKLFSGATPDFGELATDRDAAVAAFETIAELRAIASHTPLVELIERALAMTNFEAIMLAQPDGTQRAANIGKLVEMAHRFETHRFFGLADFAAHLRRLVEEPPNEPQAQILGEAEDVVLLMTIHQAKGLEFPIVIVADMGRRAPTPGTSYLLSPEHGLLVCDAIGSGREELPNPLMREYRETLREQEEAEAARLLYVAITRARDRLILSEGSEGPGWSRELRGFLGAENVAAFLKSGERQRTLEIGGAKMVLRVATPTADGSRPPQSAPAADSAARDELLKLTAVRLGFKPPAESELIASPTELADFDRCPRLYQLRHALGLPERPLFGSGGGEALEAGTIAHAVLEQLDPELTGDALDREIARLVESTAAGSVLSAATRAALVRDLARYAQARDPCERIVGREIPFFLGVTGERLTLFVRGRIDLMAERDGGLLVRDYKYARLGDDDPEAYRVQMESYVLAARGEYPGREVGAELIFIREEIGRVALPMPDGEAIRARLIALAWAMLDARASGEYQKKPAGPEVCRRMGCGYVPRCWAADKERGQKGSGFYARNA